MTIRSKRFWIAVAPVLTLYHPLHRLAVVFFNLTDYRYANPDQYRQYLLRLHPQRYGVTFDTEGVIVERDRGSRDALKELLADWRLSE